MNSTKNSHWKFMDYTEKVFLSVSTFLFFVLVVDVFIKVLTRYVFKVGLIWPDEMALHIFVVTVFLGGAVCVRQNNHFHINLLPENISLKFRSYMRIFIMISVFISGGLMVVTGIPYMILGIKRLSYSLGIPMVYVFVFIPISGAFMILAVIERFKKEIQNAENQ